MNIDGAAFTMTLSSTSPRTFFYNLTSAQEAPLRAPSRAEEGSEDPWYLHPQWKAMGPLSPEALRVIGTMMSVVGVVGTVGNFTVLFLLLRCKKLQTAANMYVFNIAAADLLMCLGNFPLLILSSFAGRWVAGYVGCKIYSFIGGLSGFVSINTLTALACDRYNAIYRYRGLLKPGSRRYSLGFLVSLWIYSFLWAMPPFFGWGQFALDGGRISCCFDYLSLSTSNVSYIIVIFCFCFGFQVVVILFCYGNIVKVVCHHENNLRRNNVNILLYHNHFHRHSGYQHRNNSYLPNEGAAVTLQAEGLEDTPNHHEMQRSVPPKRKAVKGAKKRRVEVQVTRLVVLITMSFFVAWMPFAVVALIGVFGDASVITPLVSVLPGLLAKVSTVVNPLLYAIGHPQYRTLLSRYCRRVRCCRQEPKEGRGRGKVPLPTTRGMLSSVYFATLMKGTDNGDALSVEVAVQLPATAGSSSL